MGSKRFTKGLRPRSSTSERRSPDGCSAAKWGTLVPRALQKLVRNGNATAITIPRHVLFHLGWLPGEAMILDVLDDKSGVIVRRPNERDFGPIVAPHMFRTTEPVKP